MIDLAKLHNLNLAILCYKKMYYNVFFLYSVLYFITLHKVNILIYIGKTRAGGGACLFFWFCFVVVVLKA